MNSKSRSEKRITDSAGIDIFPRRAFKKSKKGCRTCKARKVKCDGSSSDSTFNYHFPPEIPDNFERHPLCANCAKRYPGLTKCDFEYFIETSAEEIKAPSTSAHHIVPQPSQIASLRPTITTQLRQTHPSDRSRLLELRLMHHYTTTTCAQMPGATPSLKNYVWATDVPRLAFGSNLVLNALLGISALHHWALTPKDPMLMHAAGYYFDRAVSDHRAALLNVDESSAESVLATAILICHHIWLSKSSLTGEPYELPLQTYYMSRHILSLFNQMWPWLRNSSYLWYVERQIIPTIDPTVVCSDFMKSSREDLAILSRTFDEADVSCTDKSIYDQAVSELLVICYTIDTHAPQEMIQRRIAGMPNRLPIRFMHLLENKDPRALGLLARNLSLLKLIDPVWWLRGTGPSQLVADNAIAGISAMLSKDWMWIMEWPLKVISGEVTP